MYICERWWLLSSLRVCLTKDIEVPLFHTSVLDIKGCGILTVIVDWQRITNITMSKIRVSLIISVYMHTIPWVLVHLVTVQVSWDRTWVGMYSNYKQCTNCKWVHTVKLLSVDSLMFGYSQPTSSTHNALDEQHSQSSCHNTTNDKANCSGTAHISVCRAAAVSFDFSSW